MEKGESFVLENIEIVDDEQQKIDALLLEAVERNSVRAVTMLIDFTAGTMKELSRNEITEERGISNVRANAKKSFALSTVCLRWRAKTNVRAMLLAAQMGNYKIIKIFLSRGFLIATPHEVMCKCWLCKDDALVRTKTRIAVYSALCNPIWISLTSKDPLTTAFKMNRALDRLQMIEDSYESVFARLQTQVQTYCMDLLDCVENSTEQYKLINMVENDSHSDKNVFARSWSLRLIKLAYKYKLKKIVAHPVPQHVISSLVFDNIPRWHTGGTMYRTMYIMTKALLFPITALAYLFCPCTSFGKTSQEPLVKFINGASSFVTFLGLLALTATLPASGLRIGKPPSHLEWIILVWLISLLVAEFNQLSHVGYYRYFSSGWNIMDLTMVFFMLTSNCMWIVLYFVETSNNQDIIRTTRSVANGLFTFGAVMSFFRLVYICQITRFLGLLQLCLGKMVEVIFQFAFISCVVLWSFSVGMLFLHNSFHTDVHSEAHLHNHTNKTDVQILLSQGFSGLPTTVVTLAWASLSMVGLSALKDFDDGGVVYLWGALLFTLYYFTSMIVLLNMLIAMMSNSYQLIENNIEVEHKFAKTQLWMDYIVHQNFLPCPFNLIPSWHSVQYLIEKVFKTNKEKTKRKRTDKNNQGREVLTEYEKTSMELIKRYMMKKHKIDVDENTETTNRNESKIEENSYFEAKVKRYINRLKRNQRGFSQKTRSFEDSGLDVSFIGEPSSEHQDQHIKPQQEHQG